MKEQLREMTVLIQQSTQPDVNYADLALQVKERCLQVLELLTAKVLESDSAAQTTPYICQVHLTLVGMCNTLYELPQPISATALLITPLQQVIDTIEQHHSGKLDAQSTVSHVKLKSLQHTLEAKKKALMVYFRKHRVAKKLILLLAKYQQSIQKMQEMSHAQYQYIHRVLTELEAIQFKHAQLSSSHHLILLLIRLNFNHLPFMVYCKSLHTKELDQATCKIAKLNVLKAQLKTIRLIHPKPGYALEAASASVIEVLSAWIVEERICMEMTQEIEPLETMRHTDSEKIALNLSVDQLALLIKLFKEQEIFKDIEPSKLLKFFISNYTTVKGKDISFESLRNKYYNAESSTVSHVKGKLINMINALNKLK
ncbi:hypothetical protein ACHMWN_11970 [Pedobacter sp. UC225_61]|uniref:hypothetical protein n=1 Tax=Pedobacter sp. UC225_61 TaxID=3374623 RepID=UPI0037984E6B